MVGVRLPRPDGIGTRNDRMSDVMDQSVGDTGYERY